MPDRMRLLEASFPDVSGRGNADSKIEAIVNYLFMQKEELTYLLRNLDADNFNTQGLESLAEKLKSTVVIPTSKGESTPAPRRITALDLSGWNSGTFTETLEGGYENTYNVTFDANHRPILITDGEGNETEVTWDA